MSVSKERYYRIRAQDYPLEDPEALIRYQNALKWIECKSGSTVYEVGCKFGVLRSLLHERNPSITYRGIDIDQATLERIDGFNDSEFVQHNANLGLPFADQSADTLFSFEVMEHLENPTFFLSEARRVLKPGGKLILSVPNPYAWNEILANLRRRGDTEGHVASFTHQNIDALLMFAGLKLLATQGTFCRIPLSKRLFGKAKLIRTKNLFLARGFLYLIGLAAHPDHP